MFLKLLLSADCCGIALTFCQYEVDVNMLKTDFDKCLLILFFILWTSLCISLTNIKVTVLKVKKMNGSELSMK